MAEAKTRTKATRISNPLFADEKYTGGEPEWDTEKAAAMDDAAFDNRLRKSFYYYNYFYNQKGMRKYVNDWMKKSGKFTKEKLDKFSTVKDSWLPMQLCSLIMASRKGMPWREKHLAYVVDTLNTLIVERAEVPEPVEKTEAAKAPTIQDRMNDKTSETIGELEGLYDEAVKNAKATHNIYDFLTVNKVPQSQLGKYEAVFDARRAELELARSKKDEQLAEGYSHYKAADFKRLVAWIDGLKEAIEQYRGVKKAVKRTRVKKAPSKDRLISKLKYAKTDAELKLVSVNPQEIIGAQILWVYNTKTRKLGRYVADSLTGPLSVKGTKIVNYDEAQSTQKTLRKPAETLAEFNKAGKIALRKFMDSVKTTETKLNGSINADIVLLKVQ